MVHYHAISTTASCYLERQAERDHICLLWPLQAKPKAAVHKQAWKSVERKLSYSYCHLRSLTWACIAAFTLFLSACFSYSLPPTRLPPTIDSNERSLMSCKVIIRRGGDRGLACPEARVKNILLSRNHRDVGGEGVFLYPITHLVIFEQ